MHIDRRALFFSTLGAAAAANGAANAQDAPIEALARPANGHIKVAVVTDERTNIMDFASAWEPLFVAGSQEQRFDLYTVSATDAPIKIGAGAGVQGHATYTFETAPAPHLVVIGAQSGDVTEAPTTPAKSAWLRAVAGEAQIVMSICTGAFVLARSGLLDGLTATTHHNFYEQFEGLFPRVQLIRDRRFVDNGKFVSAGGLTSGIDATLHIIARYYGAEEALAVANYLEHYSNDWRTGAPTRT